MQSKRKRMNFKINSMLLKTFLSVLAVSFATLIIIASILFIWFRQEMVKDYHEMIYASISNTSTVFTQYIENAENLASEWYISNDIKSALVDSNFKISDNLSLVKRLRDSLSSNPHIHSIYLISKYKKILDITSSKFASDETGAQLLEKISSASVVDGPFCWTVKSRYEKGADISLLTVFFSETSPNSQYYQGTVAINIDLDVLCKSIFATTGQQNQNIFIIDKTGRVILHSNMTYYGEDWSGKDYIQQILSGTTDSINYREDDKNFEFTSVSSAKKDYYIVSQTEYANRYASVNSIANILLLIMAAISLTIVAVAYAVCYKLYKPFNNMVTNMRRASLQMVEEKSHDEVKFLNSYFEHMSEHINALNRRSENDKIVKLLLSKEQEGDIQSLLLQNCVVTENHEYYAVMVALFDNKEKKDTLSQSSLDFRQKMVSDIYSVILEKIGRCTHYELGLGKIFFVVSEENEQAMSAQMLYRILSEAQQSAEEVSHQRIATCVSSRASNGLESCKTLFKQTEDCLQMKLVLGTQHIIIFDKLEWREEGDIPKTIQEILDALKQNNQTAYAKAVDSMINLCGCFSSDKMLNCLIDAAAEILDVQKIGAIENKLDERKNSELLHREISELESPEELRAWFDELYSKVVKQINHVNNHSPASVIEETVDYIKNHYDDSTLSASMLAEKLNICAPYFGRLFHDFAGCSIPDYINQIRLEKARNLLLTKQSMDIVTIALRVGFNSNSYFTTAFKKRYGVSPSKLRSYTLADEQLKNKDQN